MRRPRSHFIRVARWRALTSVVTALWAVAAALAVANPFPSPRWIQALLVLTAIYLASVGLSRLFTGEQQAPP